MKNENKLNKKNKRSANGQNEDSMRSNINDFCVNSDESSPDNCARMISSAKLAHFGIEPNS